MSRIKPNALYKRNFKTFVMDINTYQELQIGASSMQINPSEFIRQSIHEMYSKMINNQLLNICVDDMEVSNAKI
jgi:hypothetical protein